MRTPAYTRTKPSGVEWIGDVPEHWEVKRLRHLCSIRKGRLPVETFSSPTTDADLPYLSMEFLRGETDSPSFVSPAEGLVYAQAGDLLLLWDGSNAGEFLKAKKGVVSSTVARLEMRVVDLGLLSYTCKALEPQIKDQTVGMGIPHVSGGELKSCSLPYPSLAEANAITAFLDRETARLDLLVAKKRELIDRLREKRAVLISRTVTLGLPPAAARTAGIPESKLLKPTGTSWLGDIPAHWEVKKFGYISIVVRGASPRPAGDSRYFDGDYIPWITVGEVTKDENTFLTETETMLTEEGAANSRTIRAGTLVLTNSGATLGVPKILAVSGCANDGIVAFEGLSKRANKIFLYYFLRSLTENLRDRIKQGSGQPNLNTEIVKSLCVPFPPLPEQTAIATYLDAETAKLDALVEKVDEAVERLQEYRTALIAAAVTGKIDVRGTATA